MPIQKQGRQGCSKQMRECNKILDVFSKDRVGIEEYSNTTGEK